MDIEGLNTLVDTIELFHEDQEISGALNQVREKRAEKVRGFIRYLLDKNEEFFTQSESERQFVLKYKGRAYVVTVKNRDNIGVYVVNWHVDGDKLLKEYEYEQRTAQELEESNDLGFDIWAQHLPRLAKNYSQLLAEEMPLLKQAESIDFDLEKEAVLAHKISNHFKEKEEEGYSSNKPVLSHGK